MFQNLKTSSSSSSLQSLLLAQRNMTAAPSKVLSSWIAKTVPSLDMELYELLATKCANIDSILKCGSPKDVPPFLGDIHMNSKTLELVASFCHGYEIYLSADNVVPLTCVAHYLGMTETQSKNNLLKRALTYFEQSVLSSWNQTLKALRTTDNILDQAVQIGLVGACVDSLITKALSDPRLLGEPINKSLINNDTSSEEDENDEDDEFNHRPSARRRLFVLNWQNEDLTTLSLRLYEPLIYEMIKRGVPLNYVTASLCNYVKKWVFPTFTSVVEEKLSLYESNSQREIIEAVERLLPRDRGLFIPCAILLQILRSAVFFKASLECTDGLEFRIGTSLHRATVNDLLILSQNQVCTREVQYDIDCIRRILKHFYGNYTSSHLSGLILVAELIEEFLAEIASDIDLKIETFIELAELAVSLSKGTQRNSDGLYKAIDIYLDKHKYLIESEREKLCQPLDFNNMSVQACDHAAKNERLPVRVTVQVLFAAQLQLRDSIMKEVQGSQGSRRFGEKEEELEEGDDEEEEEARLVVVGGGCGEESMRTEMEKMSMKLVELEKECCVIKQEIERDDSFRVEKKERKKKEKKMNLWREMKRKFGCISTSSNVSDSNCQERNKKKKM